MHAIDTNVLVRLIARDDPKQVAAAESVASKGAWVSHLVLMEAVWVLSSVYDIDAEGVATAIEMLLEHDSLALQDPDVVQAALGIFRERPKLGFSDCLIYEVARKVGHIPLATFDRELSKLENAQRL